MIDRMTVLVLVAALGVGCRPSFAEDEEPEAPRPAGSVALVDGRRPLGDLLAVLEEELEAALAAGSGEGMNRHVLRAEAITDQLLEAREPFQWLAAGYSLEARLRQLQTMADRVQAQLRRDQIPGLTTGGSVSTADVREFRQSVAQLRAELERGGGPAPVPLDSLLAWAAAGPEGAAAEE